MSDEEDDFGDFDDFEEFEEAPVTEEAGSPKEESVTSAPSSEPGIKTLQEDEFANSAQLQTTVLEILRTSITDDAGTPLHSESSGRSSPVTEPPAAINTTTSTTTATTTTTAKAYFTDRSESLWNQLAIVPQVHPIDWKRSSIRRLLLVSLGVPLDLDEILPNKNTKRLVLPAGRGQKAKGEDTKESETVTSASSLSSSSAAAGTTADKKTQELNELIKDTDENLNNWYQLASVSSTALEGMDQKELETHHSALKTANERAKELNVKWNRQRDNAQNDKEAFEKVIESLVEYAQRMRN